MPNFLLEIGTEELPADFARLVLPQLEEFVRSDLAQLRVSYGSISCNSTPRRIALLIRNLATSAEDHNDLRKGPPAEKAFNDGSPTSAAVGFAKRLGIPIEDLLIKDTEKGSFVFANIKQVGARTSEILKKQIPSWVNSLQGRRFMRWGQGQMRFSRPIRWLVAILDQELIPVALNGTDPQIFSSKNSRGHRLYEGLISIPSADAYEKTLSSSGVIVNRDERATFIKDQIDRAAKALNAKPDLPKSLFEELIDLVESPVLIEGSIPEKYLDLPPEVLSTVMRAHQRYVPLYVDNYSKDQLVENSRNVLLPKFLCIGNGLSSSINKVRLGNERVLKARLSDAEFFINLDRSKKSSERTQELSTVTFAEGLGSLLDRVDRIKWLVDSLIGQLHVDKDSGANLLKAASLCKHDLVSHMVGEFPELEGVIGGKYLLMEGEDKAVALAVAEHYLPRGTNDSLPSSQAGSILAVAERIELLVSIFSRGGRSSGSSDPYGLRRAANGILQIVWENNWKLDLDTILKKSIQYWNKLFPDFENDQLKLYNSLTEFFRQRIIKLLEDFKIDFDIVQAVAGNSISPSRILSDPEDVRVRAELLLEMRRNGKLSDLQAVVTRASRLAEKGDLPKCSLRPLEVIDLELFEKECERKMLNVLVTLEPIATNVSGVCYEDLAEGLSSGSDALASFFDGEGSVMVMSDDINIRSNRLKLLGVLRNQASILADFSKLIS